MIRSIRKTLKPVSWVLLGLFVVSLFSYGAFSIFSGENRRKTAIAALGKYKIYKEDLERSLRGDRSEENLIVTFNELLRQEAMVKKANELHVRIPGKDLKKKYNEIIESWQKRVNEKITEKELLKRVGLTSSELKKHIKRGMLTEKAKEKVESFYTPSQREIDIYYAKNKDIIYVGKTFEAVKDEIVTKLKEQNKLEYFNKWIEDELKLENIKFIDPTYKAYYPKDALVLGNLKISNFVFYESLASYKYFMMQYGAMFNKGKGMPTEKDIYKMVYEKYRADIALADEAVKRGVKPEVDNLSSMGLIQHLGTLVKDDIEKKFKVSDGELNRFFKSQKGKYDEKENAFAMAIQMKFKPSNADKNLASKQAASILKSAIANETVALAEIEKSMYRTHRAAESITKAEFEKKFGANLFNKLIKGKTFKSVLKAGSEYYIIRVKDKDDNKAEIESLIVRENVSKATEDQIIAKAKNLLKDLTTNRLKFEDGMKKYSDRESKVEEGPIYKDSYTFDRAVVDRLFTMKKDEIAMIQSYNGVYIVKLTQYNPTKIATFDYAKERVKKDYLKNRVETEFKKVKETATKKAAITILDTKIKSFL